MESLKKLFCFIKTLFVLFLYYSLLKLLQKLNNIIEEINKFNHDESNNVIIKTLIKKLRNYYEYYKHDHEQRVHYLIFGLCFGM